MKVDTVIFDMGGTLEEIWYSDGIQDSFGKRIGEILNIPFSEITKESSSVFYNVIQKRFSEYKKFREDTCIEVHPAMVWKDWVLQDYNICESVIFDKCEDLAYFWETEVLLRKCRPEAQAMLDELKERGITMAIISNTGSFTQVPRSLEKYGLASYFEKIGLSMDYGIRKPHAYLFRDILNKLVKKESGTIYVGDTISRDVVGAKNAGLFGSIQIASEFSKGSDGTTKYSVEPDHVITNLMEITTIIDEINK